MDLVPRFGKTFRWKLVVVSAACSADPEVLKLVWSTKNFPKVCCTTNKAAQLRRDVSLPRPLLYLLYRLVLYAGILLSLIPPVPGLAIAHKQRLNACC